MFTIIFLQVLNIYGMEGRCFISFFSFKNIHLYTVTRRMYCVCEIFVTGKEAFPTMGSVYIFLINIYS